MVLAIGISPKTWKNHSYMKMDYHLLTDAVDLSWDCQGILVEFSIWQAVGPQQDLIVPDLKACPLGHTMPVFCKSLLCCNGHRSPILVKTREQVCRQGLERSHPLVWLALTETEHVRKPYLYFSLFRFCFSFLCQ